MTSSTDIWRNGGVFDCKCEEDILNMHFFEINEGNLGYFQVSKD